MPTNKDLISNMALGGIGITTRISGLDTDKSNEAKQCRLYFDHVRLLVLEAKAWPAFSRRVELTDLGTPPTGWLFRYKYPPDCVRANYIVNPVLRTPGAENKIPFEVKDHDDAYGKVILCDTEDAELDFNFNQDNVELFSATFTEAIVTGLMAHIAPALRVDANIMAAAQQGWRLWLAEAANQAMTERQEDPMAISEFQAVRG